MVKHSQSFAEVPLADLADLQNFDHFVTYFFYHL